VFLLVVGFFESADQIRHGTTERSRTGPRPPEVAEDEALDARADRKARPPVTHVRGQEIREVPVELTEDRSQFLVVACSEDHLEDGDSVLASIVDESCDIVSGEFGDVGEPVSVRFDERSER